MYPNYSSSRHCGMYGMKERPTKFKPPIRNRGYICKSCNKTFECPYFVESNEEGVGEVMICPYCASFNVSVNF